MPHTTVTGERNKMKIQSAHGSGGRLMQEIIEKTIVRILGPDSVQLDDSAILNLPQGRIAFTTDSFVVTPLFFPGGDIGTLAVNGTVNDLAVMGAKPMYLSCSLIIEEGFELTDLERILESMKKEADGAGVKIVTGDTKVVSGGKADGVFINTSGIGVFQHEPGRYSPEPGDVIIVSGTMGDHGMTIMAGRHDLKFSSDLKSDCTHLNHMLADLAALEPGTVRFIRDATRGGLAAVLNEIVKGKPYGCRVIEDRVPISEEVRGIASLLGIDPLYAANEGKAVIIADAKSAEEILAVLKSHPAGEDAAIIGDITPDMPGRAFAETFIGGRRVLPLPVEDQMPRIC